MDGCCVEKEKPNTKREGRNTPLKKYLLSSMQLSLATIVRVNYIILAVPTKLTLDDAKLQ